MWTSSGEQYFHDIDPKLAVLHNVLLSYRSKKLFIHHGINFLFILLQHWHIHVKVQKTEDALRISPDIADRLRLLEQEVSRYREESTKSQAEVERLMGALKDAEMDKSCKERKIVDLERWGSKIQWH